MRRTSCIRKREKARLWSTVTRVSLSRAKWPRGPVRIRHGASRSRHACDLSIARCVYVPGASARDTDPFQLVAHNVLQFVPYETQLHHRVAGEYGAAESQSRVIGASLFPSGFPLGLHLGPLAGASELGQLGQLRVLLDVLGLVVGVPVAASPRDRVLGLGRIFFASLNRLVLNCRTRVPPTWSDRPRLIRRDIQTVTALLFALLANGFPLLSFVEDVLATLREPLTDVLPSVIVLRVVLVLVRVLPRSGVFGGERRRRRIAKPPRADDRGLCHRRRALRVDDTALLLEPRRRSVIVVVFDSPSRATLRGSSAGGVETSARCVSRMVLMPATSRGRRESWFHAALSSCQPFPNPFRSAVSAFRPCTTLATTAPDTPPSCLSLFVTRFSPRHAYVLLLGPSVCTHTPCRAADACTTGDTPLSALCTVLLWFLSCFLSLYIYLALARP